MDARDDLDSAESKFESSKNGNNKNPKVKEQSSEEAESGEDSAITMLKLPLELNLQEVSTVLFSFFFF